MDLKRNGDILLISKRLVSIKTKALGAFSFTFFQNEKMPSRKKKLINKESRSVIPNTKMKLGREIPMYQQLMNESFLLTQGQSLHTDLNSFEDVEVVLRPKPVQDREIFISCSQQAFIFIKCLPMANYLACGYPDLLIRECLYMELGTFRIILTSNR